jgi:hypothetical protein
MRDATKQPQRKGTVLAATLTFLIAYPLFLALWIPLKDSYAHGVVFAASKMAAGVKDLTFEGLKEEKDILEASFSPLGRASSMLIDIPVKTSSYTFNAPLTLAIMAALFRTTGRRWKAYGEALLLLVSVHLLYVLSLEAKELTNVLTDKGLEAMSMPRLFIYQFLWGFTDNMVIRFEPFLIGFYLFARFRR